MMTSRAFRIALTSVVLSVGGDVVARQSPATPAFDAASVKKNVSGGPRQGMGTMPGGRVVITNLTLRQIVGNAFGSSDIEVVGGPDWIGVDRWDINATAGSADADGVVPQMLKSLLAERFMLQAHVESRERPIYALVLARSDRRLGPNIRGPVDVDCPADQSCGTQTSSGGVTNGGIIGKARTMGEIARALTPYAERRVFDQTGMQGRFDFELQWSDISVFTALQEQLGLKLDAARGPVDVVVIDRVERPSEN
jgi:uncharacterized protein (TIGR03435 family)